MGEAVHRRPHEEVKTPEEGPAIERGFFISEQTMRDPVSQDVLIAAGKAVPPIAGTVVTATHGLPWTDLVAISTVVYTVVLTATTVMRNWGDWAAWIAARCAWARGLWGRLRGRA